MIDVQQSKNYLTSEDKLLFPKPLSYLPLPKRKLPCTVYTRTDGIRSITFTSNQTIPYGKWGDLCAMFLCTSANRLRQIDPANRIIEFNSIYSIMNQLGIYGTSGYQQKSFKDSLSLWTTLTIIYQAKYNTKLKTANLLITDKSVINYGCNSSGPSYMELTENSYNFFTTNVMPVQAKVIAQIKTSFELRVYLWLSRRTFKLEKDIVHIKWADLITQFGPAPGNHEPRFKKDFEEAMQNIKSKFMPELVFAVDRKMGVFLYPVKALGPTLDTTDKNVLLVPPATPPLITNDEELQESIEKEKQFQHYLACNTNEQFPAPEDSSEWHKLRATFEAIYQKTKNKELY